MEAMPPAGPFLHDEKGAKESAGGGISISLPLHPLLKTTKEGELRFPHLWNLPQAALLPAFRRRGLTP